MRFFAHRYATTALILTASLTGASACTTDADNGQSQVPNHIVMLKDRPADTITLVPPKGWDCHNTTPRLTDVYECIRPGDTDEHLSSLRIEYDASRFLSHYQGTSFDGEEPFNIVFRFDTYYEAHEKDSKITQLEKLPKRTIGGVKAYGKTYVSSYKFKGETRTYRVMDWMLGRSDGVWNVVLLSADDSDTIPPELLQAVDTITWIPTPETQSNQGN